MSVSWTRKAPVGGDHRLRVPHDAFDVALVEDVIDGRRTALSLRLDDELGARLRCGRKAALGRPVLERASFKRGLPRDASKLDAGEISAAAIRHEKLHDSPHDTVAQRGIGEPSLESGVTARQGP